jgi:hypothetical protein
MQTVAFGGLHRPDGLRADPFLTDGYRFKSIVALRYLRDYRAGGASLLAHCRVQIDPAPE